MIVAGNHGEPSRTPEARSRAGSGAGPAAKQDRPAGLLRIVGLERHAGECL